MLAVGGEDVVLRLAGPAGADLGGFLAGERNPEGQLSLPLQRGGLHVEAADLGHVGIEPAQLFRVQPLGVLGENGSEPSVPSGASSCTIGSAGAPRRASASASSWSSISVPSNSVEGRCVAPIPSPCLPHPNAPQSLGYMPDWEYIPDPAYILAYWSLLYPQWVARALHVKR